jgi:hypothetical protein
LTTKILNIISQINPEEELKSEENIADFLRTSYFLEEIKKFIAKMLSLWLKNDITDTCQNNNDFENQQNNNTSNEIKTIAAKEKNNSKKSKPIKLTKFKTEGLTESKEDKKTKFKKVDPKSKSKKNILSKSKKGVSIESIENKLTKSKKDKLKKPKNNELVKSKKNLLRNSKKNDLTKPKKDDDIIKSKKKLFKKSKKDILTNSKKDKLRKSKTDEIMKTEEDELSSEKITKVHEYPTNYKIDSNVSKKSFETKINDDKLSQSKSIIHRDNKVSEISQIGDLKSDDKNENKIADLANENKVTKKSTESEFLDRNLKRSFQNTSEIKYKNTPEEKDEIENKNNSKKKISEINKNQPEANVQENNNAINRVHENDEKITDSTAHHNTNDSSLTLKLNENIVEKISNKSVSKILISQSKTKTNREIEIAISRISLLKKSVKSISDKLSEEINEIGKDNELTVDKVSSREMSQQSNNSNQVEGFKNTTDSMTTRSTVTHLNGYSESLLNKRSKHILENEKLCQSTSTASKHSKFTAEEQFKSSIFILNSIRLVLNV